MPAKKGSIPWNKGKKGLQKHSEEWKNKMSKKMKNRKVTWGDKISAGKMGHKVSKETKRKISESSIGKKLSDETKNKISIAMRGTKCWMKNKKMPEYIKEKIRKKIIENGNKPPVMTGRDNPMWIKDRSKLKKRQNRNDPAYKEWVKKVKNRDNWKCRINNKNCKGNIVAHHIIPWSKNKELRYNINNGITLCKNHHPTKRDEENKLINFFKKIICQEPASKKNIMLE